MSTENKAPQAVKETALTKFISAGLPVKEALFHMPVITPENSPEQRLTDGSSHKTRNVKMWWTQIGLVGFQKEKYFVVPEANVIVAYFK